MNGIRGSEVKPCFLIGVVDSDVLKNIWYIGVVFNIWVSDSSEGVKRRFKNRYARSYETMYFLRVGPTL